MNKTRALIAISIFIGLADIVMTYSCFEIQEHQFNTLAFEVSETIKMIDEGMNFEHKEE